MQAKILAQRAGLGVGWLPRQSVASLLKRGELVEKTTVDPREPTVSYVAWRSDREGRALQWWLEQLRQPRLAKRLVHGVDRGTANPLAADEEEGAQTKPALGKARKSMSSR
jgi:hypothetical protein